MSVPTSHLEEGAAPPPPSDAVLPGDEELDLTPEGDAEVKPHDDIPAEASTEAPVVDDEEILEPKAMQIERVIGPDDNGHVGRYTQKPLSYFHKLELYGLLGRAVKVVMSGEDGLGVDDILDMGSPTKMVSKFVSSMTPPGADSAPDADEEKEGTDLAEAAKMMAAFAKVVSVAPEMLYEAYALILQAPKGHRKWLIERGLPTIDDEMGQDILHAFIDQNWGVMEDFFGQELPKIFKRTVQARKRHRSGGDR